MSSPRIPLTVIGGYLGAGKTTLVNRILTEDHGRRLAVIVNDFGDVAIDEALLEPAAGGVRALANGCVCCAAVDGLATALEELQALDPQPEHAIIEVSGVGDPWGVAQWGRTPGYELDGVVVVVDPLAIREWVADPYVGDTVTRQIASADVVLISHADDEPGPCAEIAGWLRDITAAPVLVGTDVSLSLLLGHGDSDPPAALGHPDHWARTIVPSPMSRAVLHEWLADAPESVVRVKGFVASGERMLIGQRFGRRVEVVTGPPTTEPALVVIGTGPDPTDAVAQWCDRASPDTVG